MRAKLLSAGSHIFSGHDESFNSWVIKCPPFAAFPDWCERSILRVSRNGLKTEIIEVCLQCPEVIAHDVGISDNRVENTLQVGGRSPVGPVPSKFVNDEDLPMSGNGSSIVRKCFCCCRRLSGTKQPIPVGIFFKCNYIRAGIIQYLGIVSENASCVQVEMMSIDLLDVGADCLRPTCHLAKVAV